MLCLVVVSCLALAGSTGSTSVPADDTFNCSNITTLTNFNTTLLRGDWAMTVDHYFTINGTNYDPVPPYELPEGVPPPPNEVASHQMDTCLRVVLDSRTDETRISGRMLGDTMRDTITLVNKEKGKWEKPFVNYTLYLLSAEAAKYFSFVACSPNPAADVPDDRFAEFFVLMSRYDRGTKRVAITDEEVASQVRAHGELFGIADFKPKLFSTCYPIPSADVHL